MKRFGKETKSVASHVQIQLWAIVREKRPAHVPDTTSALVRFCVYAAVGFINAQADLDEQHQKEMLEKLDDRVQKEAEEILARKNIGPETDQSTFESQFYSDSRKRDKEKFAKWQEAQKAIQR